MNHLNKSDRRPLVVGIRNASDSESLVTLFHSYEYLNYDNHLFNRNGDLIQNNYTFLKSLIPGITYQEILYEIANHPDNIDCVTITGVKNMQDFFCIFKVSETDAHATEFIRSFGGDKQASDPAFWRKNLTARLDGYTKIIFTMPPNAELCVSVSFIEDADDVVDQKS